MRKTFFFLFACVCLFSLPSLSGQDVNPEGNTGALKSQITTGGSYDAHSGNATRIVTDLHVPGGLGTDGLNFVRYWNSLPNDSDNPYAVLPRSFAASNWSHSYEWYANEEDTSENISGDGSEEIFTTAITVTFPDGHATRYKITRSNRNHYVNGVWYWADPRCGPPYTVAEQNGFLAGGSVNDYLSDMAPDGNQFWIYRADGSSIHFVGGPGVYHVSETFDPHGLKTVFQYNADGTLWRVTQDGGRFLQLNWANYGVYGNVIGSVQSGGAAGTQTVIYNYDTVCYGCTEGGPSGGTDGGLNGGGTNGGMTFGGAYWLVLVGVSYPEGTAAQYNYGFYFGDDPSAQDSTYPILKYADDPRYAGAMTKIRYAYQASSCPTTPPGPFNRNYFAALAQSIAREESGQTAITVSSFSINCYDGTRMEYNGLNGWRMFYFGTSAGAQGTGEHLGYQLIKLTDFTNQYPLPANLPFDRQNWLNGQPHQIWDGRGIETDAVVTPFNFSTGQSGDASGLPSEIHHVTADGSYQLFDRINRGASDPQDYSRVPNRFNHWLYSYRDENGFVTTYRRDSRQRVVDITYPAGTEHFEYDTNGFNKVTYHVLASGAQLYFGYDGRGLLQWEYNSVDGWDARKEYTYDDFDRIKTVSDGRSRSAGKDFSTRMTYNGRHQVVTLEYAGTIAGPNPTVSYEYDAHGNCRFITDEMGHRSEYQYDDYRRCIYYIEPLNATDGNNAFVTSRRWDWLYDRWIIDGVGPRDQSSHTKNEWRIQIGPAFNSLYERPMTARAHDVNNRLIIEQTGWIQPGNQPIGYWYPGPNLETHYFGYDENGQKKTYIDPMNRTTTYDYDLRNRLWKTNETVNTIPRTTETHYDYVGNKTQVIFPDTRSQQWLDYDAFGQPGRFIDERGNTTNLTYVWGPMKKLYTVTTHRDRDDGNNENQQTTFSYDLMGKPTQVLFPDGSHEDTTYYCKEGVGYFCDQPHSFSTRKGQIKIISYDARGRETYHYWSGTDNGQTSPVYRDWDDASRLTHISNWMANIYFGYDDAAQLKEERDYYAGAASTVSTFYRRYQNGVTWTVQYPNGMMTSRSYTARGQLENVWENSPGWWHHVLAYFYNADGTIEHQDHADGVRTFFGYDGRGKISSVRHYQTFWGQDMASRNYYRDERDRITSFQKGTSASNPMEDGRGDHYWYDAEGQLTDAYYGAVDPVNNPHAQVREDHFNYDAMGNRRAWDYLQSKWWLGWMNFTRKDNGLNQYRAWWNYSVINYDDDIGPPWGSPGSANGVIMQDGWVTAGYNALNQPMYIWSANAGWTYFGYDPLGRCVKRWADNGSIAYFYYDGWDLIQEGPQSGNPNRVYLHGAQGDQPKIQMNPGTAETHYFHYDANGNCTLMTNGSGGGIAEQYYYDAFGFPYFYDAWGNNLGYSPWGNRFLFTGREWLSDLKLYDYRARLYNPELGRFMQPDPKHFAAGDYNLYRYCHNDPVNHTDPFGLRRLGKGLLDVPDDVFKETYDNGKRSAESSLTNTDRRTQTERRIDTYHDAGGKIHSTGQTTGYKWPSPQAPPPKLPAGVSEAQRASQAHDHVGSPARHYGGDKASANDVAGGGRLPLVSTVSSTTDRGGKQEFYIPSDNQADRAANRGGAFFFTSDGIHFTPAPYHP